jgi:hypothetical protein
MAVSRTSSISSARPVAASAMALAAGGEDVQASAPTLATLPTPLYTFGRSAPDKIHRKEDHGTWDSVAPTRLQTAARPHTPVRRSGSEWGFWTPRLPLGVVVVDRDKPIKPKGRPAKPRRCRCRCRPRSPEERGVPCAAKMHCLFLPLSLMSSGQWPVSQ